MDEKIKISAPKSVYELLKKDCEDFKITKPDGSPNMNAFLNGVVLLISMRNLRARKKNCATRSAKPSE